MTNPGIPEPETLEAQAIRAAMSPERWEASVREALGNAALLEAVNALREETGAPWRACLEAVAPGTGWSRYLHLRRKVAPEGGPAWELLLDRRLPPSRRAPDAVVQSARSLRRANPTINCASALSLLKAEFGDGLEVSSTWLKRVWAQAGLSRAPSSGRRPEGGGVVEVLHGGGGLALIAAADAELKASTQLAEAVLGAAQEASAAQGEVTPRDEGEGARDDHGRFTAAYNHGWREGVAEGARDGRLAPDKKKRKQRELRMLPTASLRPETLAQKLLCMAATPLVTERRGFDGLDGPSGAWLGALGGTPYMPATLDKALAELGFLDVEGALWSAYARLWAKQSAVWSGSGPRWGQVAVYIDATSDPYWTRAFARSGKVERVGRVMPCLTRVAMVSGAGVPLLVETYVGTAGLKARIGPMLERLDTALGPGGLVSRLTIVDSEAGTAGAMWALHNDSERVFITVLKGQVLKGAQVTEAGPWTGYRDKDEVREVSLRVKGRGAPADGLLCRGVEMRRSGGQRPVTTLFATNAGADELDAVRVADAYLARWPNIEQLFRDARNGAGLERSHGYGGEEVTHVALETRLEQVERRLANANEAHAGTVTTLKDLDVALKDAAAATRKSGLNLARKAVNKARDKVSELTAEKASLDTTPRLIYERDIGRDSLMTCLKLNISMLVEFVLLEYFQGLGLEWRTFIEQLVHLPVTIRTTARRRTFELQANPRQPAAMQKLAAALTNINARNLTRDGRLLRFTLTGLP